MVSKRFKDIFDQYIYKNERTPLTVGTLVVCALCFLALLVSVFTQFSITHIWFDMKDGFNLITRTVHYSPQVPIMVLIIYILRRGFSLFTFIIYLLVGLFVWPIFVFGGGIGYFENYLFGYMLGFFVAIFIGHAILNISNSIKFRTLMAVATALTIHLCGFLYCFILALFNVIDYNLIFLIVSATSGTKLLYDIFFSLAVMLIAPYIKNVLWICMKPKPDRIKKAKNNKKLEDISIRNQIISDNVN